MDTFFGRIQLNKNQKEGVRMNDHDLELIKIAVLYDLADQRTKDALRQFLADRGKPVSLAHPECHKSEPLPLPRPIF